MAPPKIDAVSDQGVLARAVGIIFSPGQTFQAVVRSPRPAGILLLVCLVVGVFVAVPQFTERGRLAALEMQVQQREKLTGQPVTQEMYAGLETFSHYVGYVSLAGVFIGLPFVSVVMAGLLFVLFNAILGGTASFKQVVSVVTHSQVIGALGAVASAPVQYIQGTQTAAGPFNLGVLVPMLDPDSTVASLLAGLSFFMIWQVVVTGIGLGVLYRRRSLSITIGLMVFYVLVMFFFTVLLPRFAGR